MQIKVTVDGQEHLVKAQMIKGNLWVQLAGRTVCLSAPSARKRQGNAASDSGEVLAPMPGKITKILVQKDQSVERGQALMVMEAMKMEYTLKADVAGKILELSCQVGEQVVLGKKLAEVSKVTT